VKSLQVIGCVLLNYDKCKMQPMSNGFNMIQMYNSIHVDSWKDVKKLTNYYSVMCK
jgi:hypothetical protein